jgi:DNA-binding LytR/AlgR family response regulator
MDPCTILIVEDESLVALDMVDILTRLGYRVLPTAMGYAEAVSILDNEKPDLVLVDINLSGSQTGVDLAQKLRHQYQVPFIFITSHSDKQTVEQAAATQPNGYLVKPFDESDLYASIEVALAFSMVKPADKATDSARILDCIFIKTDRNFVKVKIEDILWLEAEHNYLYVITEKSKHIVRSSFRDFMNNLPADRFFQVHKSYLVNLQKIESFSHTDIVINGKEIPLSRNFKDDFFNRIQRVV